MGRAAVWWTVGMVAAAVVGTASGAGPASADVTLTPTQAVRGESVKLTFRVTEDRAPAHTTRVEMRLPDATPIAETTPMSVPGWAPRVATRTLDQPLVGMHHGRTSEVVTAITWFRAEDAEEGAPVELTVSLGPLPEVGQLVFTVLQTYSDGVVTRWDQQPAADASRPAPVLTLLPAGPAPAGAAPGPQTRDAAPTADEPGGFGPLVVGTAAGLLGGVAVTAWVFLRRRRPDGGDGDGDGASHGDGDCGGHGDGDCGGHGTEPPVEAGADTGPVSSGGAGRSARAWRLRE
ncbi:YcnI family protein [Plantactinospora sp. B5E13]|uniref:YcnI family copper-binding membrane protein n=1 Tax=unclassified Plantactinospora TaxID=2631981 RepID=UPI00325C9F69